MSEVLIGALVSGFASILVSYIQHNKTTAVLETKIENLTDQVKKHNSMVERTYRLEADMENAFEKIDEIKEKLNA